MFKSIRKLRRLALSVLFTFLLLTLTLPVCNAAIPEPSVPQFTVELVNRSYDVPAETTTHTDPYNGNVTTKTVPGYHVELYEIELKIKNTYCPSTVDGHPANLYYKVRTKGYFEPQWPEPSGQIEADDSQYTIIYLPAHYRIDDKVDIQVQALIGYYHESWLPNHPLIVGTAFAYEASSWSPTKTFTMPDASTLFTPPTPTVPEYSALTFVPLLIGILATVVIVKKKSALTR